MNDSSDFDHLLYTLPSSSEFLISDMADDSREINSTLNPPTSHDLATYANYQAIQTVHLDVTWAIDWTEQLISGSAVLTLEAKANVREVILDTSHLAVEKVEVGGKEVKWSLGEQVVEIMGQALKIELADVVEKGHTLKVEIMYSTTKQCSTIGWLTPR